jgi:hypothetical protein
LVNSLQNWKKILIFTKHNLILNSPIKLIKKQNSLFLKLLHIFCYSVGNQNGTTLAEKSERRISEVDTDRSERSGSFSFLPSFSSFSSISKRKKRPCRGVRKSRQVIVLRDDSKLNYDNRNQVSEYVYEQSGQKSLMT